MRAAGAAVRGPVRSLPTRGMFVVEDILRVDPETENAQVARLKQFKADRDQQKVDERLQALRNAAEGTENLLPFIKDALRDRASMGEVCGAMGDVFGAYQPTY